MGRHDSRRQRFLLNAWRTRAHLDHQPSVPDQPTEHRHPWPGCPEPPDSGRRDIAAGIGNDNPDILAIRCERSGIPLIGRPGPPLAMFMPDHPQTLIVLEPQDHGRVLTDSPIVRHRELELGRGTVEHPYSLRCLLGAVRPCNRRIESQDRVWPLIRQICLEPDAQCNRTLTTSSSSLVRSNLICPSESGLAAIVGRR